MAKLGFGVAKEKAEEASKSTAKYNYFKLSAQDDAPKRVRFVTVDGPQDSIITYGEHYLKFKNTWSRPFSCPDYDNEGVKECAICKADKGPGQDIVSDQFGTKFIMQLIERGGGESGVDALKVFKFSPFLFTTLLAHYEETGDLGDRDYDIQMVKDTDDKGKEKVRYEFKAVTRKPVALSAEDKTLIETRAKLTDIEPAYDMNEVRRMMAMEVTNGKPTAQSATTLIGNFLNEATTKVKKALVSEDEEAVTASSAEPDAESGEDEKDFFEVLKKHQGK